MQLISTEEMVFIGPGSEWFWTAVSGIVLAATFIAIYRQLRMSGSAAAIEQLDAILRESDTEAQDLYSLEILRAVRDGTAWADISEAAVAAVGDRWEKIATLARMGHIDMKLLREWTPSGPQTVWLCLEANTLKAREKTGDARSLCNLEWLAGEMARSDLREGITPVTIDAITRDLDRQIERYEGKVRVAQALRTGTMAAPMSGSSAAKPRARPRSAA